MNNSTKEFGDDYYDEYCIDLFLSESSKYDSVIENILRHIDNFRYYCLHYFVTSGNLLGVRSMLKEVKYQRLVTVLYQIVLPVYCLAVLYLLINIIPDPNINAFDIIVIMVASIFVIFLQGLTKRTKRAFNLIAYIIS